MTILICILVNIEPLFSTLCSICGHSLGLDNWFSILICD